MRKQNLTHYRVASMQCDVISKYRMLCQSDRGCLFFRGGALYLSEKPDQTPSKLLQLPGILIRFRLTQRLLRLEPRFAVPYQEGFLLSWHGGLHYLDPAAKTLSCLHSYRLGVNNPLHITVIHNISGFTDGIVYGDYWGNTKKEAVNIYRLDSTGCRCVYTFPPGQVQHVHRIFAEQGRVLICTGDSNAESAIWEAFDDFRTVSPVLIGSQQFKTCSPYMTEKGLVYATDTPLEDNAIWRYDGNRCEKIYTMPGPCIYSMRLPDGRFVFATSVEPDSSLPAWRYRFSYRLGQGVKSRRIHIILGSPEEGFHTVLQLKKDLLPMLLFQFGNAAFPYQQDSHYLYLTPTATAGTDGKTLRLSIR